MAFSAFYRRPSFQPRVRRGAANGSGRRRPPPSSDLINLVLEHADLRDALGGGRVLLRLSPAAISRLETAGAAVPHSRRLADIAVIWDEKEAVVFRVLDGGPPPLACVVAPAAIEEDQFELTPAALDHIAQSQPARSS